MGRLLDIYVAAGAEAPATSHADALEDTLSALCVRGRAEHPRLTIDDETFVAHLARCDAPVGDVLRPAHAEDLYLACACLGGNEAALTLLRSVCRPVLQRYLSRIQGSRSLFDEVEQRLWDVLLVGVPPRLAAYAGRGPLGAWLGVAAQRIALMELRHERAEQRAIREVAAHGRIGDEDPEMAAIKERFRPEFQAAVAAALETLDDRERMLYRMHLVDGLTYEQMAKAYGVHPVTVRRWLDAAGEKVREETKRRLRAVLPVSSAEFDSIERLVARDLDLSISQTLKSS